MIIAYIIIGLVLVYIPFIVSCLNSRSTIGLRVLCFLICTEVGLLCTAYISFGTSPWLLALLFAIGTLIGMEVALRNLKKPVDCNQ